MAEGILIKGLMEILERRKRKIKKIEAPKNIQVARTKK
jgi:hypothetical protein